MKTTVYSVVAALIFVSCSTTTRENPNRQQPTDEKMQETMESNFVGNKAYDSAFLAKDVCRILSKEDISLVFGIDRGGVETESQPEACLYTFELNTGEKARYRIVVLDIERDGAEEILKGFKKETKEGEEFVGISWNESTHDGNWLVKRKMRNTVDIYNPAYTSVISTKLTIDPFIEDEQFRNLLAELQEKLGERILEKNKN